MRLSLLVTRNPGPTTKSTVLFIAPNTNGSFKYVFSRNSRSVGCCSRSFSVQDCSVSILATNFSCRLRLIARVVVCVTSFFVEKLFFIVVNNPMKLKMNTHSLKCLEVFMQCWFLKFVVCYIIVCLTKIFQSSPAPHPCSTTQARAPMPRPHDVLQQFPYRTWLSRPQSLFF